MSENRNAVILSEEMPVMAIRGMTAFPNMVINLDVERPASLKALKAASDGDRRVFLTAQKDILSENPSDEDLYQIGTICTLRQVLKTPNGGMRVMIEGKYRAKLIKTAHKNDVLCAEVAILYVPEPKKITPRMDAIIRKAVELYEQFCHSMGNSIPETLVSLAISENPGYIADYIAQNALVKHTEKQTVLETLDPIKRLQMVNTMLSREIEVLGIEQGINEKLHDQLARIHRDNILKEQMRVIQSELGMDDSDSEIDDYRMKILDLKLSDENEKRLMKEVDRLSKQSYGSSEASLIRSYLDLCIELPWNKRTKERVDIKSARKMLDNDHFGLDKVKERIIEFLAVKQLAPDIKGNIICLVGPPGVGKTSIAISIAGALNRKLARLSLGGVHDEAEIRGHRKTYVGAMPGRIISAINQSGSSNPLLLLDEIDKLGKDYRGDPASALLEALDPEQNSSFRDHYLELPFDLSEVMFITTANNISTIPAPLLDRMEVIELSSYTDEEKLGIAKRHLFPKQRKRHGLNARQLKITDNGIRELIVSYTRESGVRQMEREFATICRKTAAKIASEELKSVTVTPANIETYLGIKKFKPDRLARSNRVGIVKGLAWTSVGGEILEVEVNVLDGTGKLELTGNLGDVMKESAHAAVSYIRSRANALNIDPEFYKKKDIHIHFPEGAVPKDGPSAGITMAIAVISALTGVPAKSDVAMTGEITLSGRILPIGGLKEKTMAALRNGIKTVIIPADNESDLEEIDSVVRRSLSFVTTEHLDTALDTALDFTAEPEGSEPKLIPLFSETAEPPSRGVGLIQ